MDRYFLGFSVLVLASAIAYAAVDGAHAADTPTAPLPTRCVGLSAAVSSDAGRAKLAAQIDELRNEGRTNFIVPMEAQVCGW